MDYLTGNEAIPIWVISYKHGERRVHGARKMHGETGEFRRCFLPRVPLLDKIVESVPGVSRSGNNYANSKSEILSPYLAGMALVRPRASTASMLSVAQFTLEERILHEYFGRDLHYHTLEVTQYWSATENMGAPLCRTHPDGKALQWSLKRGITVSCEDHNFVQLRRFESTCSARELLSRESNGAFKVEDVVLFPVVDVVVMLLEARAWRSVGFVDSWNRPEQGLCGAWTFPPSCEGLPEPLDYTLDLCRMDMGSGIGNAYKSHTNVNK